MPIVALWRAFRAAAAFIAISAALTMVFYGQPANAAGFAVTPLVSDQFVESGNPADGQLINAWGIALSPTSPFWVNDNGAGVSTIYNSAGVKQGLVVTIPPPAGQPGPSAPTGMIFNNTTDFRISVNGVSKPAVFIFSTEDGTISAWASGTMATLVADRSSKRTVYKGLALVSTAGGNFLVATDFHNRALDIYDTHFNLVRSFDDFDLPERYAPFGAATLNGMLYVTFALQNDKRHDDVAGPGHGFVEVFDPSMGFEPRQLIAHGDLNSPWGLAIAPTSFGDLAGSLIVGNFGDGAIHAYNPMTGVELATLTNTTGAPIIIKGLWGLTPGNDHAGGSSQNLYFTAGPNDESDGLFGSISPSP
jgi:uncharacterized protein (TIGR03118 family)